MGRCPQTVQDGISNQPGGGSSGMRGVGVASSPVARAEPSSTTSETQTPGSCQTGQSFSSTRGESVFGRTDESSRRSLDVGGGAREAHGVEGALRRHPDATRRGWRGHGRPLECTGEPHAFRRSREADELLSLKPTDGTFDPLLRMS